MANSKTFREVRAWQTAHEFVLAFYKTKSMFPDDEKFALIPQFQRAAVSIAANEMWAKIEAASVVLNAYCQAIKGNKGIMDEE